MPPEDKIVEARHQTAHKLELMERYWGAWCTILARTQGQFAFCPTRLWLVDTHAGEGRHRSDSDQEGALPGTPILAAAAARKAQKAFPGIQVHVRATDINAQLAERLDARFKGYRADGVDTVVEQADWVTVVPKIKAEIAVEDHPHGGNVAGRDHQHRSLWFVDPFGVEGIDHSVIESFPIGSEVIVNLDLAALLRHAGKAKGGDERFVELLNRVFGGGSWRVAGTGQAARLAMAKAFAESFPTSQWRYREAHLLRPTGSQDRAMVHLTNAKTAWEEFPKKVDQALRAETVIAGRVLSKTQKDNGANRLFDIFRGQMVTTSEMQAAVSTWDLGQLNAICATAQELHMGEFNDRTKTMSWAEERGSDATLWG